MCFSNILKIDARYKLLRRDNHTYEPAPLTTVRVVDDLIIPNIIELTTQSLYTPGMEHSDCGGTDLDVQAQAQPLI
jgi:hypothetical protein